MRRREFLGIIGSIAATWPIAAHAQRPAKIPWIGILDFFPSAISHDFMKPFQEGLRELGYIDSQNIRIEYHSAEQRSERAAEIAADFVRREADVIVALATPAAHAAKKATTSIPIAMLVANPLATGLVSNLARPGGNLTGISTTATDLAGKRLELLRELRPGISHIAFLGAANDPNTQTFLQESQTAATAMGMRFQPILVTGPEEFDAAFKTMVREGADGVIVQPLFVGHRNELAELAMKVRLPMIADQHLFVVAGGLAAYGTERRTLFKRLAYYVDRILDGAKPANLPIEQPTKFNLAINLKTAKALGLTIPSNLLSTADELIE
jgi:putative ABC transport system substrate-binding protein